MDDDLMARRVPPPSEPAQSSQTAPPAPTEPITMPAVNPEAPVTTPWDPTAALAEVPWDRPTDYAQPTDTVSADEPAWDKPTTNDWFEPEPLDDRTPDMFDAYADPADRPTMPMPPSWAAVEASPEPASAVAAPVAPEPAADPDEAFAPVLGDVSDPFGHQWPESNGHDAGRNAPLLSATPATEVEPEPAVPHEWPQTEWKQAEWPQLAHVEDAAPQTLEENGVGPNPSAELFEWDAEPEIEAPAEASSDVDAAPEEVASEGVQVTPKVTVSQLALPYSTSAPGAPTNLVVRIELSIVDDGRHVLTVTPDRELPTPRHPEFEPRAPRALDPKPEPASADAWIEPAAVPKATETAPWDRPGATAAPTEVARWSEPASYANRQPHGETAMPGAIQPASAAAIASDSELWFRSTEPSEAEVAAAPAAAKEPSSAFMGALTVGMAVLVIFLVLVFIQLLTSLLR